MRIAIDAQLGSWALEKHWNFGWVIEYLSNSDGPIHYQADLLVDAKISEDFFLGKPYKVSHVFWDFKILEGILLEYLYGEKWQTKSRYIILIFVSLWNQWIPTFPI